MKNSFFNPPWDTVNHIWIDSHFINTKNMRYNIPAETNISYRYFVPINTIVLPITEQFPAAFRNNYRIENSAKKQLTRPYTLSRCASAITSMRPDGLITTDYNLLCVFLRDEDFFQYNKEPDRQVVGFICKFSDLC